MGAHRARVAHAMPGAGERRMRDAFHKAISGSPFIIVKILCI
jgi:hypothetical protein